MFGDWDWTGAQAAMETALALEPENAAVHNHGAWLAIGSSDLDRALYEARAALDIEPSSLFYRNVLARVLVHRGDYGNAISLLSRILELDSTIDPALENLALAYIVSGEPESAVRLVLKRASSGPLADHMIGLLARANGDAGVTSKAERAYAELLAESKARYVPSWPLALAAVGLDRKDETIEHLSRGAEEREAALVFLQGLPLFDRVRSRQEYQRIAAMVGPALSA